MGHAIPEISTPNFLLALAKIVGFRKTLTRATTHMIEIDCAMHVSESEKKLQTQIDVFGILLITTVVITIWLYGAYMHKHGNSTFSSEMILLPKFICIVFGNLTQSRKLHYPSMFAQLLFLIIGIIYSLYEVGSISRKQVNDGLSYVVVIFLLIALGITVLRRNKQDWNIKTTPGVSTFRGYHQTMQDGALAAHHSLHNCAWNVFTLLSSRQQHPTTG